MWRLYRLTDANDEARSEHDLRAAAQAFAVAIVAHAGGGHWFAPTAPAKGGGVDIWLHLAPLAAPVADFERSWAAQLQQHGLIATRVSGRN